VAGRGSRRRNRGAAGAAPRAAPARKATSTKRLGYHEQREWEQMEAAILGAEEALEASSPGSTTRRSSPTPPRSPALRRHGEARTRVDALYARWAELDAKRS
jgi:ATP-binding cassette subfamily F protein uup